MTGQNGWAEYKLVVLRRLDDLEKAGDDRDEAAEERHQCVLRKITELRDDVVHIKANRRANSLAQWLKVAGLAFVVAYAVAHGEGLVQIIRGIL